MRRASCARARPPCRHRSSSARPRPRPRSGGRLGPWPRGLGPQARRPMARSSRVGTHLVVVLGQSGAHIPSTALIEGRDATVVGIVRRPYPTATDRRFALLPRETSDIRLGSAPAGAPGATAGTNGGTGRPAMSARPGPTEPDDTRGAHRTPPRAPARPGPGRRRQRARVADRSVGSHRRPGDRARPDGFRLDDGTAVGTVVLRRPAAELVALVEPGDAINAIGAVETTPGGPVLVVADPAGLVLAGSPSASAWPIPARPTPRSRSGQRRRPRRRDDRRRPSARRPRAVPR